MTGYGRGDCARDGFNVTVELSSVNRKQAEISVNLPRELEMRMRAKLGLENAQPGDRELAEDVLKKVKAPNADFAEILQGRTPDLWISNAPARTGDTGAMFKKIIERALTMTAPKASTKDTKNTKAKASKTSTPKAKPPAKTR